MHKKNQSDFFVEKPMINLRSSWYGMFQSMLLYQVTVFSPPLSLGKFSKGFYPKRACQPSCSTDFNHLNKFSFHWPQKATCKMLQSVQGVLRSHLKMLMMDRQLMADNGPCLSYKIPRTFGWGELNSSITLIQHDFILL